MLPIIVDYGVSLGGGGEATPPITVGYRKGGGGGAEWETYVDRVISSTPTTFIHRRLNITRNKINTLWKHK